MVLLFCLTIILAVIAGLGFPQSGKYAIYIPYMIGVMLFFNFLDVKIQFRRSRPRVLLLTLLLSAIVIPGFVYFFLSIGFLPILLKFVLNQAVSLDTSPYTLLGQMTLLVLLPYFLSQTMVHILHQQWLVKNQHISKGSTLILLFCIVGVSIGKVADQLTWHASSMWLAIVVLAIYLIHGGMGYAIGWVWSNAELKTTLPFICSSRNIQLVFAIAVLNFPPLTYVPIIMGLFFHHLTNAFWIWILGRNQPPGRLV
ncbi:MAG: hypothetical protein P8X85_03610 [Desulfobacterales bacterium]